jgi:large subunit ribosomal protein L5
MTEPTMEPEMTDEQPVAAEDQPVTGAAEQPMAAADEQPETAAGIPVEAETPVAAEAPEPAAAPKSPKPKAERADKAAKPAKGESPKDEPAPAEEAKAAAVAAPAHAPAPAGPRGLRVRYTSEVVPALVKQFEYANPNQVPKLEKIVVNVGLGEALTNAKAIDAASGDIVAITGQKPIVTKAKRSIAQFHVRTNNPIGLKVTLRGQRMWDFLERLTLLTLPRIRDFRGIPSKSFDGRGNYSLGMREQIAFPEIDYDKVDRLRGLEISIVTTAKSDEESKRLLELLGMPFAG